MAADRHNSLDAEDDTKVTEISRIGPFSLAVVDSSIHSTSPNNNEPGVRAKRVSLDVFHAENYNIDIGPLMSESRTP
jgi:hypothetical protein